MRSALTVLVACLLIAAPAGAEPPVPNPYAGPDGTSSMHGDSLASDTTPYAGPGATPQPARTLTLPAVCPTILAGKDGLVQALCTEYADRAPSLYLLAPSTLTVLARDHLSSGALLGGVYAYVDSQDRLVTVDGASGSIVRLAHHRDAQGTWRISTDASTPVPLPAGDAIVSVAPGYDGAVWFATAEARAGFVTADGQVRQILLGPGEQVANSIATSPRGVAVTTDHATYLVRQAGGAVQVVWRAAYDRGKARKPGQLSWGSGATPTFFGPATGTDYVAITDNARPREHLIVYRAATGAPVCSVPILGSDNSGTENSPIGWDDAVYVASTYGYPYPSGTTGTSDPASAPFVGGMQRFDVVDPALQTASPARARRQGRHRHHRRRAHLPRLPHHRAALAQPSCHLTWTNPVPSAAVPRLSRGENVLYTVERGTNGLTWALDRIAPGTGAVLSRTPLAIGPQADTLQMVGTILPDGTLLQGTITGLVAVDR